MGLSDSPFIPNKSSGIYVVPPFECTWLEGDDLVLNGAGCLSFQVKGQNDATVILSTVPGAKRLPQSDPTGIAGSPTRRAARPLLESGARSGPPRGAGRVCTIIFGSHGNSKFKVEKDECDVVLRHDLPQACLDRTRFKPFWLNLDGGILSVGNGSPGCGTFVRWADAALEGAPRLHVGLSSWDSHVGYRNVLVTPALPGPLAPPDASQDVGKRAALAIAALADALRDPTEVARRQGPPALARRSLDACTVSRGALASAAPNRSFDFHELRLHAAGAGAPSAAPPARVLHTVCHVLVYLELSWRATDPLWDRCVEFLARHFSAAALAAPRQLALLPAAALLQILSSVQLDASEYAAFCVVELWAFGGGSSDGGSPRGGSSGGSTRGGSPLLLSMHRPSGASPPPCCSSAPAAKGHGALHRRALSLGGASSPHSTAAMASQLADADYAFSVQQEHCVSTSDDTATACAASGATREDAGSGGRGSSMRRVRSWLAPGRGAPTGAVPAAGDGDCRPTPSGDASRAVGGNSPAVSGASLVRAAADVSAMLQRIKFPLMSAEEQAHVKASPLWEAVPELRELLEEAHTAPEAPAAPGAAAPLAPPPPNSLTDLLRTSRRQRRCPAGAHELLYISDGDQHGVLYFLGTSRGACAWMNPHLTGAVRVESSSPFGAFSDPRKLVSRCYHGSLCAEGRAADGFSVAFWSLDLGPQHRLACNHYTLRQNDSTEYPRHWALQGSNDGTEWHDLKVHENDGALCAPAQFHSWPVDQHELKFYRHFRVLTRSAARGEPVCLNLTFIELYGYLM